ncbi:MAG: hypothetical protein FIB07_02960 [Candidatus Methanoperedens sp.]|nr:hypothetical protein [Candidatus Methanoperedens sp.]
MKNLYKILIIPIIIFLFIIPALADDIEWVDPQEKTLRLMEFVIRDGFYIEASDFYDNSSLISVYDKDHNIISKNLTRINDWMNINDQMNITIVNLQEKRGNIGASLGLNVVVDQSVRIETRVAGRPIPRVSIAPNEERIKNKMVVRRSFVPGSEISFNFSVRNDGKAVLKDTILRINSSLPLLVDDKLYYELLDITAGNESDANTVRFRAPYVEEKKNFTIFAQASGNDRFGKTYKVVDSINIEVKPQTEKRIDIRKSVTEKIYMGDVAVVSVFIKNNESRKIENLTLEEAIPGGLIPVNPNMSWNFSLGPLEEKSISYMVKPQKPGTYFFQPGSSRIEYQDGLEYNKNLDKLIVNGPYVVLSKYSNIENPAKGDNVTVTIEAKNQGNVAAIVKIMDSVPVNYSLKSGNISFSNILKTVVLRAGNATSFSYTLNINDTGIFILPPAKATVLDQFLYQDERYIQKINSGNISFNVKESIIAQQQPVKITRTPVPMITPEKISTSVPTGTAAPTPKSTPGFQEYVVIILFIVILRLFRS